MHDSWINKYIMKVVLWCIVWSFGSTLRNNELIDLCWVNTFFFKDQNRNVRIGPYAEDHYEIKNQVHTTSCFQ